MDRFVFQALDRIDGGAIRVANRTAHREHIRRSKPDARCILGGPLRYRPDGEMIGTLLVFEADGADAVRRFMADDPYVTGGLFKRIDVQHWAIGLGDIAPAANDPFQPASGIDAGSVTKTSR